jgi:enoyl-CoA hydratase
MTNDELLLRVDQRVATVTLNRPHVRNALSARLLGRLAEVMSGLNDDDRVDVVVLTGSDPAFCAGLDLSELSRDGANLRASGAAAGLGAPWPGLGKPVIGAVNGPAVTGGLEVALHCDLLIASDRAYFADTHTKVGLIPGWGLSVLLPQAVGLRRAKEMSATGRYVPAEQALAWGLVNHVVPHAELLDTATGLARQIAANDQPAVRELFRVYDQAARQTAERGLELEAEAAVAWLARAYDPAEVARRRGRIVSSGRAQL